MLNGKLPKLVNIIDNIQVAPHQCTNNDIDELRESIYLIIDDFINNNIIEYKYDDFNSRLYENTMGIFESLYENIEDTINIDLAELIDEGIYSYFEFYGIKRSETTKITTSKSKQPYSIILKDIKKKDTHEQGTMEWFEFRWNHITASSAWKAFEHNASLNQLILSKCKPINPSKYSNVNITSATHHGHKFEPLSILLYEKLYDTIIGEYGCIESNTYHYLAASPDGINIKMDNPRYGRLLEIKNPISREITGIPKKEYWVQMQMQMEVLNLDECDFLETSFKEYKTEEDFKNDGTFSKNFSDNKKGIIICFNNGSSPIYKYTPLAIDNYEDYEEWRDNTINECTDLTWISDTYWYLEKISCVLLRRNKQWFNAVKHKFKEVWDIILKERIEGYDHRKSKKRTISSKKLTIKTPPLLQEPKNDNNIFKISTESLDNTVINI